MDSHDIESYFRQHRKTLAVVFLIVCMLAVSGFFMGMRQTERQVTRNRLPAAGKHEVSSQEQEIPSAPKYKEISNAEWLAVKALIRPGDTVHQYETGVSGGHLVLRQHCYIGQTVGWVR